MALAIGMIELSSIARGIDTNIHASITGVITEITPAGARIARRKEG